jgi:hypothetical protein
MALLKVNEWYRGALVKKKIKGTYYEVVVMRSLIVYRSNRTSQSLSSVTLDQIIRPSDSGNQSEDK